MKAVFFIRHHNDYDSLAAVADGWARAAPDNQSIIYISTPALKWKNDPRTTILSRTPRVRFVDLSQVAGIGQDKVLERSWQRNLPDDRLTRRALEFATEMRVAPGYDRKLRRWLDKEAPGIIAFDWWNVPAKRKSFDHFGYQAAIAWTREKSVPLVSLPHGLFVYWRESSFGTHWDTPYDCIFLENEVRVQMFHEGGHPLEQLSACGAPRYDVGWVERMADVLEEGQTGQETPHDEGDVRIVFFGKRPAYYYDFDEQLEWLRHLADHPKVKLTIQPHPRGQKLKSLRALADHPGVVIDARTPASLLIRRADIVSTLTSSVMVEGVITGREILYPKFLTTVETFFDQKGACIALGSMEETHGAIDRYLAGERVPRENYDAFLQEAVFAGKGPNTIEHIIAKMTDMARSRRMTHQAS